MNCRNTRSLLSAERDRPLAPPERADLDAHLAWCPDCRQSRARVASAIERWRGSAAQVSGPDTERAWQEIQREIHTGRPASFNRACGLRAWALPLGAATALALLVAFVSHRRQNFSPRSAEPEIARADFVEVANNASSMVYVDDQSGWLVVWTVDDKRTAGL